MSDAHTFEAHLHWPADPAQALPPDPAFSRNVTLGSPGKPDVPGSAPTVYGGEATRYNPEELQLLALSECHMLTFLAIASRKRLQVIAYEDRATGTLATGAHGSPGKMSMQEAVLRPVVTFAAAVPDEELKGLHEKAHANCFIANSVNFPVRVEGTQRAAG